MSDDNREFYERNGPSMLRMLVAILATDRVRVEWPESAEIVDAMVVELHANSNAA